MVKIAVLIAFSFFMASPAFGQQDSTAVDVQQDLEAALEDFDTEDPDFENERLSQFLQDLSANPVNINTATVEMLLAVPGVNLKTARAITEYRREVKPFEQVDELIAVRGIGRVTLEKMRPYVTAGSGLELGKALYTNRRYWTHDGRLEVFSRYRQVLERQEGYRRPASDGGYLGSPATYYQRFRYRSDHLSVNLSQEKDPGETLAGPAGFDYNSWHLALFHNGKLRSLAVGDYSLSFGQGLLLWDGGAFGKGREVIGAVNRNGRGIAPYASAQETNALKGVAATYGGKLQLSGFYSFRNQTASVVNGDTLRLPQADGLSRTENERDRRNNLKQELYGGHLQMEFPFGIVGLTGYRTVFNKFIGRGTAVYNRYDFSGVVNTVYGAHYTFLVGPVLLFGEAGRSRKGGYGLVSGLEALVGGNTGLAMAYRKYGKDFHSFMGDGFGEASGDPQNEEGIYIGLRHELGDQITFSAYMDQYRFPSPRFGINRPSRGYDWLGMVEVRLDKSMQFYVQARGEVEDDEYETTDSFGRSRMELGTAGRLGIRAQFEYWVNPKVRLRSRGEMVQSRRAGRPKEYGYLLYQDVRFVPGSQWTFDARITVFNTDSFFTRLYQFENDLLYVLSNELLYKQGQRLYLLVNYEPFAFLELWAKYGITLIEDELQLGSGLDTIEGNRRSEVGLQLRLRF